MAGFWKKLAKVAAIAAPIVAAPFTGGASLAAIGALSGAAGAKLSGAGWKGTLAGAGLGAIPGIAGAGKAATAAKGLGGLYSAPAAITSQGVSNVATNPNIWGQVLNQARSAATNPDVWKAGGAILTAGSGAATKNRENQVNAQLTLAQLQALQDQMYNQAQIAREQEGRASRADAFNQLRAAQYVQQDRSPLDFAGKYSRPAPAASDAEKAGAAAMEAEVRKRLEGGNQVPAITRPPALTMESLRGMDPSIWERLMGLAGTGASIYGAARGGK